MVTKNFNSTKIVTVREFILKTFTDEIINEAVIKTNNFIESQGWAKWRPEGIKRVIEALGHNIWIGVKFN